MYTTSDSFTTVTVNGKLLSRNQSNDYYRSIQIVPSLKKNNPENIIYLISIHVRTNISISSFYSTHFQAILWDKHEKAGEYQQH